jgi:two-component system, OmpR family, response regulator
MNVLVVDDTKNIRTLLTKCLEMEGYSVKTAEEGRTALSMIEKERFDLAFLDIKMPFLSGTEVLRRMREMGVNTPVIIITAYATVKNAVDCTQLGAVYYLQKPFTAGKIKTVLSEFLKGSAMDVNPDSIHQNSVCDPSDVIEIAENLIAAGKFTEAISILKAEVAENPFSPEIFALLASASEKLGKISDAKKYRQLQSALL